MAFRFHTLAPILTKEAKEGMFFRFSPSGSVYKLEDITKDEHGYHVFYKNAKDLQAVVRKKTVSHDSEIIEVRLG